MYKVKKSKDGTVTLSCSGATHELLYWHTYTLTPEAGERLAAALREEGCRGSLQKMTEQAGFGITVYVVSPARSQKHNKINVRRPFCGIINARKIKELSEKPCTCRRHENVQTAQWTDFYAGVTRNVRLIAA